MFLTNNYRDHVGHTANRQSTQIRSGSMSQWSSVIDGSLNWPISWYNQFPLNFSTIWDFILLFVYLLFKFSFAFYSFLFHLFASASWPRAGCLKEESEIQLGRTLFELLTILSTIAESGHFNSLLQFQTEVLRPLLLTLDERASSTISCFVWKKLQEKNQISLI